MFSRIIFVSLAALGLAACLGRDLGPPPEDLSDNGPLFFGPRDGGSAAPALPTRRGGGRRPQRDGGAVDAGAPDPYCGYTAEPMRFSMNVAVVETDVIVHGVVESVSRDSLVLRDENGPLTLAWTLPPLAQPPLLLGMRVRLMYRPYQIGTLQAASIVLRDDEGRLLFVGDTGLHHVRITGTELQIGAISVADRGCPLFPLGCGDTRNLDLLLTDKTGNQLRVPPGDKASFAFDGRTYEAINVNMAELAYLECNVVPGRYRSFVIQLTKNPL